MLFLTFMFLMVEDRTRGTSAVAKGISEKTRVAQLIKKRELD